MKSFQVLGSLEGLSVATNSTYLLDLGKGLAEVLGARAFDSIWSLSSTPGFHTPARLGRLAAAVTPGGQVVVQEPEQVSCC